MLGFWFVVTASPIRWPDGKSFAFTIFDDPDSQTLASGKAVYGLLEELGLRTTKGVWPVRGPREPSDHGGTCAEPDYAAWCQRIQQAGFEMGLHNVTLHTSTREETQAGLARFAELFGSSPKTFAHHYFCQENLYWGENRVSGWRRSLYNVLTRGSGKNQFFGHVEGHPYFWGDLCREQITYVRNFVFPGINTLKDSPLFPYHDPTRPYVRYWYSSSEGSNCPRACATLTEANQDQLEAESGACILYTHFGHGYSDGKTVNPRFRELITRLSRKNGWFIPVGTLLDYLIVQRGGAHTLTPSEMAALERRWLWHKIRYGTA